MKVQQVKSRSSRFHGETCGHCGRVVSAGQWIITFSDQDRRPAKTFAFHAQCMKALSEKAGEDVDQASIRVRTKKQAARDEWERRRDAIIETGDIRCLTTQT